MMSCWPDRFYARARTQGSRNAAGQIMAGSDVGEPDDQVQEAIDDQAGVSVARSPARTSAAKRQALHDRERRLLDQERLLLDKGSHAVERVKTTTAGAFWSRLNAVDFMNSSLQFAAL